MTRATQAKGLNFFIRSKVAIEITGYGERRRRGTY